MKSKRDKLKFIDLAMQGVAHTKISDGIYKLNLFEGEISHLIQFTFYNSSSLVAVDFGIKHALVEIMSVKCVKAVGGELYSVIKYDENRDFLMRTSLGRVARWGSRWRVEINEGNEEYAAKIIHEDLSAHAIPFFNKCVTLNDFIDVLASDAEPLRWLYTNGAIRFCQIVYAATLMGMEKDRIIEVAEVYGREIDASLIKKVKRQDFVNCAIEYLERQNKNL